MRAFMSPDVRILLTTPEGQDELRKHMAERRDARHKQMQKNIDADSQSSSSAKKSHPVPEPTR